MGILTQDIGALSELGRGVPPLKLCSGIGYNTRLFRGALWALQTQAFGTVGSGNAAVTAIARGTVPATVTVTLQAANQPLSHTYTGGTLTILPATNATPAATSTANQIVAYLKAQAAVMVDFLDFVAGGDGTGILPAPTSGINFLGGGIRQNVWIPASQSGLGILTYAIGGDYSFDADNRGGLPGANGTSANPPKRAVTAYRGTYKLLNDQANPLITIWQDAYCVDDDVVSALASAGRGRVGKVVQLDPGGAFVFVDMAL